MNTSPADTDAPPTPTPPPAPPRYGIGDDILITWEQGWKQCGRSQGLYVAAQELRRCYIYEDRTVAYAAARAAWVAAPTADPKVWRALLSRAVDAVLAQREQFSHLVAQALNAAGFTVTRWTYGGGEQPMTGPRPERLFIHPNPRLYDAHVNLEWGHSMAPEPRLALLREIIAAIPEEFHPEVEADGEDPTRPGRTLAQRSRGVRVRPTIVVPGPYDEVDAAAVRILGDMPGTS
jgi:hypothetical protein